MPHQAGLLRAAAATPRSATDTCHSHTTRSLQGWTPTPTPRRPFAGPAVVACPPGYYPDRRPPTGGCSLMGGVERFGLAGRYRAGAAKKAKQGFPYLAVPWVPVVVSRLEPNGLTVLGRETHSALVAPGVSRPHVCGREMGRVQSLGRGDRSPSMCWGGGADVRGACRWRRAAAAAGRRGGYGRSDHPRRVTAISRQREAVPGALGNPRCSFNSCWYLSCARHAEGKYLFDLNIQ